MKYNLLLHFGVPFFQQFFLTFDKFSKLRHISKAFKQTLKNSFKCKQISKNHSTIETFLDVFVLEIFKSA